MAMTTCMTRLSLTTKVNKKEHKLERCVTHIPIRVLIQIANKSTVHRGLSVLGHSWAGREPSASRTCLLLGWRELWYVNSPELCATTRLTLCVLLGA